MTYEVCPSVLSRTVKLGCAMKWCKLKYFIELLAYHLSFLLVAYYYNVYTQAYDMYMGSRVMAVFRRILLSDADISVFRCFKIFHRFLVGLDM